MDTTGKIFAYCERGLDPGFWAEPFNAVSNVAFLLAAALGLVAWSRVETEKRGLTELCLIALVAVIGIGSFLFHTLATPWAQIADVLPITIFMVAYLAYALRRLLSLGWLAAGGLLLAFCASLGLAEQVRCGGRACLNGSAGYMPALAALVLVGWQLRRKGHAAAGLVLTAAAVFLVSLAFRTLDRTLCPATALFTGRATGTHVMWHILNATLLYLLLFAAIRDRSAASAATSFRSATKSA